MQISAISQVMSGLPEWLYTTFIVVFLAGLLWFKLGNALYEASQSYRFYLKNRHRLELEKLHYEIEKLKSEGDFPPPPKTYQLKDIDGFLTKSISQTKALMYGMIGPLLAFSLLWFYAESEKQNIENVIDGLIGSGMISFFCSLMALLIQVFQKKKTVLKSFAFSTLALFTVLLIFVVSELPSVL